MGKLLMFVMLLSSIVMAMSTSMIHGINSKDNKEIEAWFQMVSHANPKLTKLKFYFHAIPQGKNATEAVVAQATTTMTSHTLFGLLIMVDYPLTEGPEPSSKLVGRAQGFYSSVSMTKFSLSISFNLVFPDGSTISTFGIDTTAEETREMAITGGSGKFRLAQGVVIFRTVSFDIGKTGNAVVEVNVLAMHY